MIKKLLSLLFLVFATLLSAHAFTVPQYQGFVNDYAGVLSEEQKAQLTATLTENEKQSGNEVVLIILKNLEGDTVENAANEIFNTWKIGKKGKDNGVLFLVAIDDRRMRIEVGYGLEPELTDLESNWILDETVKPFFKAGDYYGGIAAGIGKIIEALGSQASIVPQNYQPQKAKSKLPWEAVLFMGFFGFQWLVSILARTKSWWLGGVLGGIAGILLTIFAGAGFLLLTPVLILAGLLLDYIVSKEYRRPGPTAWWAGGNYLGGGYGSSDRDSFGGFGGFGGGSSGGGGNSSSW